MDLTELNTDYIIIITVIVCVYKNFVFLRGRPKNKYIRITKDEHFRVDEHYLSNVSIQAEKSCAYDLEDVDVVWLNILNGERALMGKD